MRIEKPNVELYPAEEYDRARKRLARVVGPCVAAFAALVYLLTLSPGVFPGQSAELMAVYSGLEPVVAPAHTVWGSIVGVLASLGAGGMVFRLNFFSLLVGVAAVWLLFDIVLFAVSSTVERESATPRHAAIASAAGGAAAALALAFSVPFWMCSTRLQYQGFDFLALLALARLLVWYLRSDNDWALSLLALLFGALVVESLGTGLFVPVFLLVIVRHWVRRGHVSAGRILASAGFGALGLASAWLVAHAFGLRHDISLRGYEGTWAIVRRIFLDQARLLQAAFPQTGWLNLAIVAVAPWLAAGAIARRALNETREWGIMVMHAAMSVAVVLSLGNAPFISPWGLFRETGVLPVSLMGVSAMTCGYLVAYWYLIVVNSSHVNIDGERTFAQRGSIWFGCIFGALTAAMLPVAAGINALEANGRCGRFVDDCARELVESLDGRKWIVSDGLFDYHILIDAHRTGRAVRLIELQNGDSEVYLRHLGNVINEDPDFRGLDIGKLQNGAALGVLPFLQDWIECDTNAVDKMVVMSAPDLLVAAGRVVVPCKFCFKAGADLASLEGAPFLEDHREFWPRMQALLAKSRGVRDAAFAYRGRVRRQVGFVANNAGVLLEDLGMDEDAFQTYNYVRQLDPDNISALLNLVELLRRREADGFHASEKASFEKSIDRIVKELEGRRLPIWSLSRSFGYVRSPFLFTQLGWAWAASGQPGIAIAGIQRAEQIAATPATRLRAREAEAELVWRNNDIEGAEEIYEDILREDPANARAMISLSRVQTRRGSLDKARDWLDKARESGADKTALAFEVATLDLASGRPAEARVKLSEVTDVQPGNLQAWGMLGIAALQTKDYRDVEQRILPKMISLAGTSDNYLALIVRGQLLFQRDKDIVGARDAFARASFLRPGITMLMEWILRLDFMLDDKESAEEHARQIMRANRGNSFANYIMGSIMLSRGRRGEAEDFLRRSVGAGASPEALNDLAELLRQNGNLDEAEERIRVAIGLAPGFYVLWDTLGGILAARGDLAGAEEAYLKALEEDAGDLRVHLNYARLLLRKGETVKAREIVMKVNAKRGTLGPAEQADLAELVKEITPGRKK